MKQVHRPGSTGNPRMEQIMKYQLADLNNGPFGDVYDTLPEAEAALAQEIAAGQAINDEYAQECADAGRDVPQSSDFFSIVEINNEADD